MKPRGLIAAWGLSLAAVAGAAERLPEPLADGVWMLPGSFERGRQPDGNSLLLQGPEGLVIVDTGRHAEHAAALQAWVKERGAPLRAVVNTHWHLDHVGGNAPLRRAASALRSHGSAALRDAVNERMPRSNAELQQLAADPATDAGTRQMLAIDIALYAERAGFLPDELVDAPQRTLQLGGRQLTLGLLRGVSGGDVWVYDSASRVLALGDFITLPVPFLDTACPEEWRQSMERLEALPFERVVPGHGPVMSRADFLRWRGAFDGLLACAASERPVADCAAGWTEALGPLLPGASARSVAPMLGYYFQALLRAPEAQRGRFCAASRP
jgi:glyoxylase-like metal-dependent hydrolase (beta-lactamase superfamily II)